MRTPSLAVAIGLALAQAAAVPAADCPADRFTLWNTGVLRGANVFQGRNPGGASNGIGDGDFAQSDFDDLAAAGANYVQISHAGLFAETPPYALDAVAQANLDNVVAMASAAGLYAVIAFRSGPGRNENAISNRDDLGKVHETIWSDQAAHDAWVAMLRYAADRYGSNPVVVGLSVMVEPNNSVRHNLSAADFFLTYMNHALEDVNVLYRDAIAAMRQVNTDVPILLEPEAFGSIPALPFLATSTDPHVVYTPHDYTPFDYTHELVAGGSYPGDYDVEGDGQVRRVDQPFLASYLGALQTFEDQHGVPGAVTEFGVHRTAPNAATFLTDRIGIQDTLGSWAVWTWQPAGFDDPFNMHDPGAVHDVLVAAWATNCRRGAGAGGGGETGGGQGTISGRVRLLKRNGKLGKWLPKATVTAGDVSQRTKKRRPKGGYSLTVPAGTQTLSVSAGRKVCHVGATGGPRMLAVTVSTGATVTVDVFCGRR